MYRSLAILIFSMSVPVLASTGLSLKVSSSEREAIVYSIRKGEKKYLGKTPLKLTNAKNFSGKVLRVEKEGFAPTQIFLPTKIEKHLELRVDLESIAQHFPKAIRREVESESEQLLNQIMNIQVLLTTKKLSEAEAEIRSIERKYPNFTVARILRGNLLFLKGQSEKAKSYYMETLERLPAGNSKLRDMVETFLNGNQAKIVDKRNK